MPAAYVQSISGNGTTASKAVTLNGVAAGNTLVVHAWWDNQTRTASCADDKGDSFGAAKGTLVDSSDFGFAVFVCQGVAGGNTQVTITLSGAPLTGLNVVVSEYSSVSAYDTHVELDTGSVAAGTDGATTGNSPTLANQPALGVGIMIDLQANGTTTAGTGWTNKASGSEAFNSSWMVETKRVTATTPFAATGTVGVSGISFFASMVVLTEASGTSTAPAPPSYPLLSRRNAGPTPLRSRAHTQLPLDQAPQTNTEFVFPTYPASGRLRKVGPVALRTGVQHPILPLDRAAPANTFFTFPTYPPPVPMRMTGPMALRIPVQHPPLPLTQAPQTNTEFIFPTYAMRGRKGMVGPVPLRGMRLAYSHGWETWSIEGAATSTLSPFDASAAALETFSGDAAAALSPFAVNASGLETYAGSGSAAMQPFAVDAAGLETFSGSATAAVQPFAIDATGTQSSITFNTEFIYPTYSASGLVRRMVGPVVLRSGVQRPPLPLDQAAPTNTEFVLPRYPTVGRMVRVGPSALRGMRRAYTHGFETMVIEGLAAAAMSSAAVDAAGLETFTSTTASAAMSAFTTSSTGAETFSGTGSAAMAPFAALASALQAFAATASAALAPFGISVSASLTFTGAGLAGTVPFAAVAAGTESLLGSATAAVAAFAASAAGGQALSGDAVVAVKSFSALAVGDNSGAAHTPDNLLLVITLRSGSALRTGRR